jgi:hypothetical protein
MVFKFLSKGKKSEYFLEAPPATNGAEPAAKIVNKVTEVADKVADKVTDKVAEVADKVTDKVAEVADKAKSEVVSTKPASGTNGATAPEAQKAKKFKKAKSTDAQAATEAKPVTPKQTAKPVTPAPEPAKNFATEFSIINTPRRRPGPSLDMYKNMAKEVTPRK